MFENLFNALTDPAALVALAAILTFITAAGKMFIKIGNTGKYAADKNDWFDSIGAFLMKLADAAGKLLSFLGPGNQQKSESGQ